LNKQGHKVTRLDVKIRMVLFVFGLTSFALIFFRVSTRQTSFQRVVIIATIMAGPVSSLCWFARFGSDYF
jgi:multisubunit Na+/H+ antiporter MnhF subunit